MLDFCGAPFGLWLWKLAVVFFNHSRFKKRFWQSLLFDASAVAVGWQVKDHFFRNFSETMLYHCCADQVFSLGLQPFLLESENAVLQHNLRRAPVPKVLFNKAPDRFEGSVSMVGIQL